MPPAARLTDLHMCPMIIPPMPPGPVMGPCVPTVMIGKLPAAVLGDVVVGCIVPPFAPPDTIVKGSATVLIGGRPAARLGDATAYGGAIVLGCLTVMIGG